MELAPSSLFEHAERRQLGNGAWVEVRSGWLADGLAVRRADGGHPWRAERRQMYDRVLDVPRLVSFHHLIDEPAPHPRLKQIRRRLNDTYGGELGEPFTTAGLCSYRDGNDSVAWHGDTIGRSSTEDTMVAIVSLGATRVFALRPRGGGHSLRLQHRHGDLLVMGGSCQRTWEHSIPKTSRPTGRGSASSSGRTTSADQPFTAATAAVSRSRARCVSTGATGLSGSTRGLAVTITRNVSKLAT